MRKSDKKTTMCALAAFAVLSCGAAVSFSFGASGVCSVAENAEASVFGETNFTMREGASVRYYKGENEEETKKQCGLRFAALLDETTYRNIQTAAESESVSVIYGMLIAPYSKVQEQDLTAESVFGTDDKKVYTWVEENAAGKLPILNITYSELLASSNSGYYEIKGSISELYQYNYTKEFVGRAYIAYTTDGVTEYKFADYFGGKIENNARSATYVAQMAQNSDQETEATKELVKEMYIDGLRVEDKATQYVVNTYVNGDLEKSETLDANIAENTEAAQTYEGFTLDLEVSDGIKTVYANGKTVVNFYYTADDVHEEGKTQIYNGGFEQGDLQGWTLKGDIGDIASEKNYWAWENNGGYAFGLDGDYMFSSFKILGGDEKVGYLKSSPFVVSENGWLTFKMGSGADNRLVYLDIVSGEMGAVLKRFANKNFRESTDGVKSGCTLNAYKADLSDLTGEKVYVRVTDADNGGSIMKYGTVFLDSFNAMHIGTPSDNFSEAYDLLKDTSYNVNALYNGTFDDGLAGWTLNGEIGEVNSYPTFWNEKKPFNNNGKFFSAYGYRTNENGAEEFPSYEGNVGTLQSSPFVLGGNGIITFGIGGMMKADQVFMEVRDWETDAVYGKYYNENLNECALVSYVADLREYVGKTLYVKFTDNGVSDYGLIFADDIITQYTSVPSRTSYNFAKNLVNNTFVNGGFERDLDGWYLTDGAGSAAISASTYWADNQNFWWRAKTSDEESNDSVTVQRFEKDGNNFYMSGDGGTGSLKSAAFTVLGDGILSFKLGGNSDNVYVEIRLANGDKLLTTVRNDSFNDPLCAQTMLRRYVDLSAYKGQDVYVKIVDNKDGGIGFATFDSMLMLTKSEAQMIAAQDKAYYETYFDELMNTESTLPGDNNRAKEIVQTIRNYYANLTLLF